MCPECRYKTAFGKIERHVNLYLFEAEIWYTSRAHSHPLYGTYIMNHIKKIIVIITLGLVATAAVAKPKELITHNHTDVESNAFVAGTIASQHPTKARSDGKVLWAAVRMACFGHTTNGQCWATIKMATDTQNPVELGRVVIDLETGLISPAQISANGYTFTATAPGEVTLTQSAP